MEAVGGLFLPYKVKYWYWEQVHSPLPRTLPPTRSLCTFADRY